jgi:excisionase family DNA binding protein
MKWDFRHHLLTQIEMLRGDLSHEEFSKRLGDVSERCLARYVAGKSHLQENEFKLIAKALSIDAQVLAQAWASSLGLRTYLRMHVKTLQRLARDGRVPCARIGKYWRFRLSDLDRWVGEQQNRISRPFRVERGDDLEILA